MFHHTLRRTAAVAVAVAALAWTAAAAADTEARAIAVADYTVFVDPPTGFVFVKLPRGWRFAGTLDASELSELPGTVVTSLLSRGAEAAPLAGAVPAAAVSATQAAGSVAAR